MHVFIDTNVFLSFFHYSSDELEELRKLIVLLENDKIVLWLPEQVQDEFYRNRDNKIADALKRLRTDGLGPSFPQMVKAYPEYKKMKAAVEEFEQNKRKLEKKLVEDIEKKGLMADRIIDELFSLAQSPENDDKILNKARLRFDLGNPPGKKNSYGDSVNWEILLESIPVENDLHFITDDSDYFSEVNNKSFNSFLSDEWHHKKKGRVHLYKNITGFFKAHFPQIKLAYELQKEIAIEELTNSSSFNETHWVIGKLSRLSDFSDTQINAIAKAATENTQVSWIAEDRDVYGTLYDIVMTKHEIVDEQVLSKFIEIYAPS